MIKQTKTEIETETFKLHYLAQLLQDIDHANEYSKNQVKVIKYKISSGYSLALKPTARPALRFDKEALAPLFEALELHINGITCDFTGVHIYLINSVNLKKLPLLDLITSTNSKLIKEKQPLKVVQASHTFIMILKRF